MSLEEDLHYCLNLLDEAHNLSTIPGDAYFHKMKKELHALHTRYKAAFGQLPCEIPDFDKDYRCVGTHTGIQPDYKCQCFTFVFHEEGIANPGEGNVKISWFSDPKVQEEGIRSYKRRLEQPLQEYITKREQQLKVIQAELHKVATAVQEQPEHRDIDVTHNVLHQEG